jgi:hypothetical protein
MKIMNTTMNNHLALLMVAALGLNLVSARAQFGTRAAGLSGPPPGPRFSGHWAKLFGDNSAFSATLEMQTQDKSGQTLIVPGKVASTEGKSRFEMDIAQIKGGGLGPQAATQMKAVGMDRMVSITRPDKKVACLLYPGLQAYLETPMQDASLTGPESDFKVESVELGKETIDGHPCVKNKVVVTDKDGAKHESTVWNATDFKSFPLKIEATEEGRSLTLLFIDVQLAKPDGGQFDPPADFKRYDSMSAMMQETMMKQIRQGMGAAPR